mmetsp:Transcript_13110/g.31599  ORF Transcript_13110/g.31599 Transcript_13110/m.31599 type:complete len:327 (-) Transcript_13110:47-1027(-)
MPTHAVTYPHVVLLRCLGEDGGGGPRGAGGHHHRGRARRVLHAHKLLVAGLHVGPGRPHHGVLPAPRAGDGHRLAPAHGQGEGGRHVVVHAVHGARDLDVAAHRALHVGQAVQALAARHAAHGHGVDVCGEVGVERRRERERLRAQVRHLHGGVELAVAQGDGLGHHELLVPHGLGVLGGLQGHLHGGGGALGGLGQLPVHVAREAVHLDVAGPELRPAVGEPAGDGLGLVELGVGAHVQHVVAVGAREGGDDAAEQVRGGGAAIRGGELHRGEAARARHLLDGPGGSHGAHGGGGAARGGGGAALLHAQGGRHEGGGAGGHGGLL